LVAVALLNPALIYPEFGWRLAFLTVAALGVVVFLIRMWIPESPRWLGIHGLRCSRREQLCRRARHPAGPADEIVQSRNASRPPGANRRFGLVDAALIKDNHIAIAGGVAVAIRRVRAHVGHLVKIEVEVDTLAAARRGA
jgi:hypothetical protein